MLIVSQGQDAGRQLHLLRAGYAVAGVKGWLGSFNVLHAPTCLLALLTCLPCVCCRFDALLHPVVTYTTQMAAQQAAAAQQALQASNASANTQASTVTLQRSLLTGIPYGIKDLMAVPGYPTSWGLTQLQNRTINTVCLPHAK